jgi:hypothetical protein
MHFLAHSDPIGLSETDSALIITGVFEEVYSVWLL